MDADGDRLKRLGDALRKRRDMAIASSDIEAWYRSDIELQQNEVETAQSASLEAAIRIDWPIPWAPGSGAEPMVVANAQQVLLCYWPRDSTVGQTSRMAVFRWERCLAVRFTPAFNHET